MKDIIIIGATGLVGNTLLNILEKNEFEINNLILVGNKNIGNIIKFQKKDYKIISLESSLQLNLINPIIIFCTQTFVVKQNYQKYLNKFPNCYVIDNSSYFRQTYSIIIPPLNFHLLQNQHIISNPNCVTAGLMMMLYPINKNDKITKIRITSFQSVSGSGHLGQKQLISEQNMNYSNKIYKKQIYNNVIPEIGEIMNDITEEEQKIIYESKKILNNQEIDIYATCVRIPVMSCHSISLEFKTVNNISIDEIKQILVNVKTIKITEELPDYNLIVNTPDIIITRLRKHNNSVFAFISFDNLYRGAAYNVYEIIKLLL